MNPLRGFFLLTIFLVLTAGYMNQEGSIPVTTQSASPLRSTPLIPEYEWAVTVNQSGNHSVGDTIKINGTINCDVDEVLILIMAPNEHTCLNRDTPEGPCRCCQGVSLKAPVTRESNNNNTWSVELNTSEHGFYQGCFELWVVNQSCEDSYAGNSFLNLTPAT